MKISHNNPNLSWYGAISLEQTADTTRAWRIPHVRKTFFDPALVDRAATHAGIRIAFRSDTTRLGIRIGAAPEGQKIDLYADGHFVGTGLYENTDTHVFENLPAGEKILELWLPQRHVFPLAELEIDDGATLRPHNDERPRWITYGSSITHCGEARSPSYTWPAIVARSLHLNHTNLGFGGQCHLDIEIARLIRDLPADYLSICAGINIYGQGSLNARSFPNALIGFIEVVREKHPLTPLAVVSPIYSFDRETTANAVGWTLPDYRASAKEVVERLQAAGDHRIWYFDGLEVYGEALGHMMPDRLHPNADGYESLGQGFLRHVAPVLFEAPTSPTIEDNAHRGVENIA